MALSDPELDIRNVISNRDDAKKRHGEAYQEDINACGLTMLGSARAVLVRAAPVPESGWHKGSISDPKKLANSNCIINTGGYHDLVLRSRVGFHGQSRNQSIETRGPICKLSCKKIAKSKTGTTSVTTSVGIATTRVQSGPASSFQFSAKSVFLHSLERARSDALCSVVRPQFLDDSSRN